MTYNVIWLLLLCILLSTLLLSLYLQNKKLKERLKGETQRHHVESELINLKNQLNPHFLFNSFNTLVALIEDDPKRAIHFTQKLTDFYRMLLVHNKKILVPFKTELKLVENYCSILNQRFGNRLKLYIQKRNVDLLVPPLTLQLLVENAVKHNVFSKNNPLNIDIYFDGNYIVVANNKKTKKTISNSTKKGLENIKKRYKLLTNQMILINNWDHRFEVKLPLIVANKSSEQFLKQESSELIAK